jgi:Fe2+ transport system protein FeoA
MSQEHDQVPLAHLPLSFIQPGEDVCLAAFGDQINQVQREQLTAYGLGKSRPIRVLQQRPMTVILADEVELALEHAVARYIWVEKLASEA